MRIRGPRIGVAVGVLLASGAASAAPFTLEYYEFFNNQWNRITAVEGTDYTVTGSSPDWSFTLLLDEVHWAIWADDPTLDSIDLITATGSGSWVSVIVGDTGGTLGTVGPYQNALTTLLQPGAKDFGGLAGAMASKANVILITDNHISGTVAAFEVARIEAGGELSASISNNASSTEPISIEVEGLFSGSYTSNGAPLE